jgi:hypothetical protein
MNYARIIACLLAAALYWAYTKVPVALPVPTPVVPVVAPVSGLAKFLPAMSREDRSALADAYEILQRSVAANPASDPVFPTVGSVRNAHRAALLCVWKGVLGNQPGKYPGLSDALEGVLVERIGKDDIPLNPALQQEAAKAFGDIAATFR